MSYSLAYTQAIVAVLYVADKVQQKMFDFVPTKQLSEDLNIPRPSAVKILQALHGAGIIADRKIEQPALFMFGDRDPVINFQHKQLERMKTIVPNLAEPVMYEGCGHWTQQERPSEVSNALIDFLDGLPKD